jgi:PAS domain S-box-containing protein
MEAALPKNEKARLAALERLEILGTPPEVNFDRIVQLAAQICRTPIALLTLVAEDHQWFKARIGLEIESTSRADSFCAHAILQPDQMLVVEDTFLDYRFATNPLVTGEPHIRFYAGAPITTDEGFALGTLCTIDRSPRQLTPAQKNALQLLGHLASNHLELHQHHRQQLALFQSTLNETNDGIALLDHAGTLLYQNLALEQLLGYSTLETQTQDAFAMLFAEPTAYRTVRAAMQAGTTWQGELSLRTRQGEVRPVELKVAPIFSQQVPLLGYQVTVKDIMDRRVVEESLRQSEMRFSKMFHASPTAISLIEVETGACLEANARFLQITGYTREEVINRPCFELGLWPDLLSMQVVQFALQEQQPLSGYEISLNPKQGTPRTMLASLELIELDGRSCLLAMLEDITERKQAEIEIQRLNVELEQRVLVRTAQLQATNQALKNEVAERMRVNESLRLLERAVSSSVNGILIADMSQPDYPVVFANPVVERITGYSSTELLGKNCRFLQGADREQPALNEVRRALHEKRECKVMLRNYRKDGTPFWNELFLSPVRNDLGIITHFVGVLHDVTEQVQTERELTVARDFLKQLMDTVPDPIFVKDAADRWIDGNAAFWSFLGRSPVDVLGTSAYDFFPKAQADRSWHEDNQAVVGNDNNEDGSNEDGSNEDEEILPDGQGKLHTFLVKKNAFTDADGSKVLVGVMRDISRRKEVEEALHQRTNELRAANASLARAARLKDEFLAGMSHELRTPLSGILGLAEALQEQLYGPLTEKQMQSLRLIEESGRHLLDLINDILDLTKIESGHLELHWSDYVVNDLCQASLKMIKQLAQQKRLTLVYDIDPPGLALRCDGLRLKQMLVNLLSNAVKFTPDEGKIGLTVTGDSSKQLVLFTVWDTGIGIAPENFPRLFQPFTQLDSRLSRQYSGTGLGLSLVHSMAKLHGGGVELQSTLGNGSQFTIRLPWISGNYTGFQSQTSSQVTKHLLQVETRETGRKAFGTKQPLLLLADDNEINGVILQDYLEAKGYRVIRAHTGREAIAQAEKFLPELILMDIQMPDIDGLDAIQTLRRNPHFATTPVIALTALAMPGDQERCFAAGATEYLTKPLHLGHVTAVINRLLEAAINPARSKPDVKLQ